MTRCSLYRHFYALRARRDRKNLKTFVTATTKRRRSPHNPTTVSPVGYSANGGHYDSTSQSSDAR
jgi:hypothetical protein